MSSKNVIDLSNRVAIVTGGTRGIGYGIAKILHDSGAHVAITGRSQDECNEKAKSIGERAKGFALEVTRPEMVKDVFGRVAQAFGKIHILVNNAGVAGRPEPVSDISAETWKNILSVNLDGAFYCTQAVLPFMAREKWGRIVNVASVAGKEGNPMMAPYSAAKAGLIGLTKSVGKEVAKTGVLVNCITPGVIETELTKAIPEHLLKMQIDKMPIGRAGQVSEVAEMTLWLCSEKCSFSTGAVFDLSGGRATY